MTKKTLALALVATMGMGLTACGSQRSAIDTVGIATQPTPAANEPNVTERLNAIAEATADWSTLSAGGTIGIGGAKNFSSKMQMRMERGKSIYISLRPLLGIEVGRLVVVGDSVIVIDKLHKRYIAANASLLTNGVPVDVTTLQDIFLGRPCVLGQGEDDPRRRLDGDGATQAVCGLHLQLHIQHRQPDDGCQREALGLEDSHLQREVCRREHFDPGRQRGRQRERSHRGEGSAV